MNVLFVRVFTAEVTPPNRHFLACLVQVWESSAEVFFATTIETMRLVCGCLPTYLAHVSQILLTRNVQSLLTRNVQVL